MSNAGRPRIGTRSFVILPDDDLAALDVLAERQGTTRANLIRKAVRDLLVAAEG